eukprot:TRINITY_DN4673_c0_g1_i1.p1 TRINITY_DN4673_c0_g1~~TRINITY_DN4673_c0_g1_i1.p1  ORF type:complete len:402 (-),score=121.08 TRINITY_DN4673_c0_g1_i1:5-1210(-)
MVEHWLLIKEKIDRLLFLKDFTYGETKVEELNNFFKETFEISPFNEFEKLGFEGKSMFNLLNAIFKYCLLETIEDTHKYDEYIEEIENYFKQSIKLNYQFSPIYFYCAKFYLEIGNKKKMFERLSMYEKYAENENDSEPTLINIDEIYRLKSFYYRQDFEEQDLMLSRNLAKQAVASDINNGKNWFCLAMTDFKLEFFRSLNMTEKYQNIKKPLNEFNLALKNGYNYDPALYFHRGIILQYLSDFQSAKEEFVKAIELDSTFEEAIECKAHAEYVLKQISENVDKLKHLKAKTKRNLTENLNENDFSLVKEVTFENCVPRMFFCVNRDLESLLLTIYGLNNTQLLNCTFTVLSNDFKENIEMVNEISTLKIFDLNYLHINRKAVSDRYFGNPAFKIVNSRS